MIKEILFSFSRLQIKLNIIKRLQNFDDFISLAHLTPTDSYNRL